MSREASAGGEGTTDEHRWTQMQNVAQASCLPPFASGSIACGNDVFVSIGIRRGQLSLPTAVANRFGPRRARRYTKPCGAVIPRPSSV